MCCGIGNKRSSMNYKNNSLMHYQVGKQGELGALDI